MERVRWLEMSFSLSPQLGANDAPLNSSAGLRAGKKEERKKERAEGMGEPPLQKHFWLWP